MMQTIEAFEPTDYQRNIALDARRAYGQRRQGVPIIRFILPGQELIFSRHPNAPTPDKQTPQTGIVGTVSLLFLPLGYIDALFVSYGAKRFYIYGDRFFRDIKTLSDSDEVGQSDAPNA